MNKHQIEKIKDYLAGMKQLKGPGFSVGAVIINETDRAEIIELIKKNNINMIKINDSHPDIILKAMINFLEKGRGAVLDITKELPPKIYNQLSNLADNRIYVRFAGETQSKILNPIPQSGFIVLLINYVYYQNIVWGDIITSFCNLTR